MTATHQPDATSTLATVAAALRSAAATAADSLDQAALTATADLIAHPRNPPAYAIRHLDAVMHQLRARHATATDANEQAAWLRAQGHIRTHTDGDNYRVTLHDHTHARREIAVRATGPAQAARRALREDPLYVTSRSGADLAANATVASVAQMTLNGPRPSPKASP